MTWLDVLFGALLFAIVSTGLYLRFGCEKPGPGEER